MSEPKNTGNAADELAQQEQGADFESVNRSSAPGYVSPIEVTANVEGGHLVVRKTDQPSPDFRRGVGELEESAQDKMAAEIFEDNTMITPYALGHVSKRKSERGALIFYAIRSSIGAAPTGDRILVKRDTLESAYSCRICRGKGHYDFDCPTCKGTGEERTNGVQSACRTCKCLGYERASGLGDEKWYSCGKVPCEGCRGVGWAGGIIVPDIAQNEPACGIVVTVGPKCIDVFPGDRVLISKYAGHTTKTPEGDQFTIMHEHEVLELLKDLK